MLLVFKTWIGKNVGRMRQIKNVYTILLRNAEAETIFERHRR